MDEAQFKRDEMNFHSHHHWADVILPSHHRQWFSINIWASVCGANLTSKQAYRAELQIFLGKQHA
jgi:hypothetical protein